MKKQIYCKLVEELWETHGLGGIEYSLFMALSSGAESSNEHQNYVSLFSYIESAFGGYLENKAKEEFVLKALWLM